MLGYSKGPQTVINKEAEHKTQKSNYIELAYGGKKIKILLSFEPRTRLSITVHPDKRVTAKSPLDKSISEVTHRLQKKAPWIFRQLDYFEQFHPRTPPRKYMSGETHYYLGRQYRLRVKKGNTSQVKLIGRFFKMELPDPSNRERAKKLMQQWYSKHAKSYLTIRINKYLEQFQRIGAKSPEIRFRRMKSRWGSCSNGKTILLNTELVKAPIYCVDYVIIHELCHLIHPTHSKAFFQLLSRFIPDWEKRKRRLEKAMY
jgi:hypothetical protein